ncbi:uncharacterized protein [Porites lutea]|uniref:uncharacterized protein n=1 Tax=Porites lutea TaxID=51062 RepID=UPI003CC5049A
MATRACHLELVEDLSTDHFIIALKRIVAKEALRTALVEAEGILNSRLVTYVSSDADDIEALTPNHFLLLRPNPSNEEADVGEREINSTKLWRQSQTPVNFIWKRFTKENIPSLTERKKWREKRKSLKEGDVVLVAEPNQLRGMWPLDRIVSTHPGQDGMDRAVTVRTQYGEYKRPITKLCFLEEAET